MLGENLAPRRQRLGAEDVVDDADQLDAVAIALDRILEARTTSRCWSRFAAGSGCSGNPETHLGGHQRKKLLTARP